MFFCAVTRFILSDMTTRLFYEKSMNAVLRKVSPLRSAFRSEAKRIMQVSKLNKHVFLSTSSLADPTGFVVSVIHIQWNVTFKITNI